MRKLLIVDDEKIEREGIKMLLKKMNADLEILEAANGKQACKILEEQKLDMLLTDIKMPFMSGLELIRIARKNQADIPIAIFSGFGEFTYAQEAIKYGVTDYILKPVNPEEFKKTVGRMLEKCQSIEEREEEKNNGLFLDKYLFQKYLFTGKENYIQKILYSPHEKETPGSVENIQNMMLLDTNKNFFEEHGIELVHQLQTLLGRRIEYLDLNMNQMLLLFFKSATDNYERIAGVIRDYIEKQYGIKCYIAVSGKINRPEECPGVYQELETLMENKFYDMNRYIFVADYEDVSDCAVDKDIDYQKLIKENIKQKNIPQLWNYYQRLLQQIKNGSMDSQMYVKFMFSDIAKSVYEEMQAGQTDRMKNRIEEIYMASNLGDICHIMDECIREFENSIMQAEQGERSDIEQVKKYIQYHVDEDLSIDVLAAKVYLSQGYLSYVFKKETGLNLSRYIRQCRMEKAKELLKETNMKIVQICEKVGFSNVSYFCQSFRDYCGVSPERYRKGEETDEKLAE